MTLIIIDGKILQKFPHTAMNVSPRRKGSLCLSRHHTSHASHSDPSTHWQTCERAVRKIAFDLRLPASVTYPPFSIRLKSAILQSRYCLMQSSVAITGEVSDDPIVLNRVRLLYDTSSSNQQLPLAMACTLGRQSLFVPPQRCQGSLSWPVLQPRQPSGSYSSTSNNPTVSYQVTLLSSCMNVAAVPCYSDECQFWLAGKRRQQQTCVMFLELRFQHRQMLPVQSTVQLTAPGSAVESVSQWVLHSVRSKV